MKKTNNPPKMKWYNYLVYLGLPLNAFVTLIIIVLYGRLLDPLMQVLSTIDIGTILVCAYPFFINIIAFFLTLVLKRSLKKFKTYAPKLITFWYIFPILSNIGSLLVMQPLWQYMQGMDIILVSMIVGLLLKALIMIPANAFYFLKREEIFGN